MKKIIFLVLAIALIMPTASFAEDIQKDEGKLIKLSTKVPVSLYGFVSAQMMYSDSQLSSFGTLNNDPASYNKTMVAFNRVVDESVDGKNNAFLGWSIQNTRIGFLFSPYDFKGKNFEVDARIELDFWSTANLSASSVIPRIRRAYAAIGQKRWRLLFGQEWDLFSPLNPGTLNIGDAMWRQGNLGFRRPQIQATFNFPIGDKGSLVGGASINMPSNSLWTMDNGNTTCMPMFEGTFGYTHKLKAGKVQAFLSGAYARHNNAVATKDDVNNWALAASLSVPVHKYFIPAGEFQYGYSMGLLLTQASDTTRQSFMAGWAQVKSMWLKWLETNVGYGIDALNADQVNVGFVSRNQTAFLNVKFKPISAFMIGLEYDYLRTHYKGSPTSQAHAGMLNVMYIF